MYPAIFHSISLIIENFVKFMEIYNEKVIPSRISITKSMECQSKVMLTQDLKKIFLALDKTTDTRQRSMTAVLLGPLIWLFFWVVLISLIFSIYLHLHVNPVFSAGPLICDLYYKE
uniref:Uncharacterized protein n=1 Tax=Lepeophtheirus salmonis TaxID=72036 RepID=A0A0K2VG12_LEPSM